MMNRCVKKNPLNDGFFIKHMRNNYSITTRHNLVPTPSKLKFLFYIRFFKITVGKVNPPYAVRNQRLETAQQEKRVMT
jgi:hypothetical protein